jgi:hypothetical protein
MKAAVAVCTAAGWYHGLKSASAAVLGGRIQMLF